MARSGGDVIELGSSDEETEPAQKKAPPVGHKPNAMVHIPPGVSIKSSLKSANLNPINKLIEKGLTITKVKNKTPVSTIKGANLSIKPMRNGRTQIKPSSPIIVRPNPKPVNILNTNIQIRPPLITSQNLVKFNKTFVASSMTNSSIRYPVPVKNLSVRSNLPVNVTRPGIKHNVYPSPKSSTKRPITCTNTNALKKRKVTPAKEVMTVNLDDDDTPATSKAGPQWYLRPEETRPSESDIVGATTVNNFSEKSSTATIEKQNNSEPSNFIEIEIVDSPVKPVVNKRAHEVGAELPITIDDSPVKPPAKKQKSSNGSGNESDQHVGAPKNSKKKLKYPNETSEQKKIEIELEPMNSDAMNSDAINSDAMNLSVDNQDNDYETKTSDNSQNIEIIVPDNVIEIIESPAKAVSTPPTTPKKDKNQKLSKVKPILISSEIKEPGEFNTVYQEFIDLCLSLEDSNDMKTIVEKKIKNYYKQVPKEYTDSEEFLELVQSKILAMKVGPEKLYLYIKDVVDELNLQRKMTKAKPTEKEIRNLEAEKFQYGEESEFDSKRQRQIRKLEKTLKKLHRAIQKLEEQEVDFDDEEDSVYLLTERYKERMVRVHAKFCQLTNTKMPSEPRIQIQPRPGQPEGPAKRLEKWVNKKVPIGKPLPFPDFHDVLRCVREANEEDKLGWNEADIMEEARDLFTRCGKKLQRRRQENEWRLAASRITLDADPAEKSDDLKKKLDTNKQLATKKEADVFNKYADKQSQLKLEAEEICDKEADESPAEEEDEDEVEFIAEESSPLENKEKRKERLRRLLKEKSKMAEKKEMSKTDSYKQKDDNHDKLANKETDKDKELDHMEIDTVSKDKVNADKVKSQNSEKSKKPPIDENKVDSDVDELHLLQKLHSDEVNTSTAETTDSESPIDISDTLSSSDNKKMNSDVISIENSSYSETESKEEKSEKVDKMTIDKHKENKNEEKTSKTIKYDNNDRLSGEIECASSGIKINKTNNDEYNESVESILLGSSDEEGEVIKDESPKSNDECVNLKDDALSIGETVVQETKEDTIKTGIQKSDSQKTDFEIMKISPVDSTVHPEKPKSAVVPNELYSRIVIHSASKGLEKCVPNLNRENSQSSTCLEDAENRKITETNTIEIIFEKEASEDDKSPENQANNHCTSPELIEESDSNHTDSKENETSRDTLVLEANSHDSANMLVLETIKSNIEKESDTVNQSSAASTQNSDKKTADTLVLETSKPNTEEESDTVNQSSAATTQNSNKKTTDKPIETSRVTLVPEISSNNSTDTFVLETSKPNTEEESNTVNQSSPETVQNSVDEDEQNLDSNLDANSKSEEGKESKKPSENDVDDVQNNSDLDVVQNLQNMIENLQSDILGAASVTN